MNINGEMTLIELCFDKVIAMYNAGKRVVDIARSCNASTGLVYKILRLAEQQGIEIRKRRRVSMRRKLSEEEIVLIHEMFLQGYPVYTIAKMLNRNVSTIYNVLRRLGDIV